MGPLFRRRTRAEPPSSSTTSWRHSLPPLARVNVVGASGSGKSTFAQQLADVLRVPCVQMDQVFWEPNWTEPPDSVFFPRLARALSGERWVLDGNYHRTVPIKWLRTTTIIWLDYSLLRVLLQVARRSVVRAYTSQELWPNTGNRESFRRLFSRQSIVLFSFRTHASHRIRYEREQAAPSASHLHFVRLTSPREARVFLQRAAARQAARSCADPTVQVPSSLRSEAEVEST